MKKTYIAATVLVLLAGCDQYKNMSGTTRVNEITVYGSVPCVMAVGENGALAISCDWNSRKGAPPT